MSRGVPPAWAAPAAAASLPPRGMPGLDPAWSRLVVAPDAHGVPRTWHVLDTGSRPGQRLTLLCVHGNPTWSYLWRRLLSAAPDDVRVVAVDQLDMGWSERTGEVRRLADRIDDLDGLVPELGIATPIVTVAHDWGGPVSLGWAVRHPDRLAGVVLTNTAVHQPPGAPAPTLIRMARAKPVLAGLTVRTDGFVRGTAALSRRAGGMRDADVARAFAAPYRTPDRRAAIGTFVADIPLEDGHPSMPALRSVAAGLERLADIPVLMLWGPDDPVFSDRYLADLRGRLPHADIHRYEGASHLVLEDAPAAVDDLLAWVAAGPAAPLPREGRDEAVTAAIAPAGAAAGMQGAGADEPLWSALDGHAADPAVALVEMAEDGRRVSWRQLAAVSRDLAAGFASAGVRSGDRVALLVPPGADLVATVYALWRIGAVVVVADAGLGIGGMRRALRGAHPRHLVAVGPGLALARTLHVPGIRVGVDGVAPAARGPLGVSATLAEVAAAGRDLPLPAGPAATDDAVVVFTSGATGPAKGVVYTHGRLQRQREALRSAYAITAADALVAAFTPWAVLGPALGIPSVIPAVDPRHPGRLGAPQLADAVAAVRGTLLWASPAVLTSVVATADRLHERQREALRHVRLLLAAGAPVRPALLRAAADLMPAADARTPYGMTEALPLTDVTLVEIEAAGPGHGVLVGRPLPGVEVAVSPLSADGRADGPLTAEPGVTGEIAVRADHVKDRYDALWATQSRSARDGDWHRTGDVGHLDVDGRLWVEGRLAHVVTTPSGPLTPVGVEQRVEGVDGVALAACVGVGPVGTQAVVVVVQPASPRLDPWVGSSASTRRSYPRVGRVGALRLAPAPLDLADAVRAAAGATGATGATGAAGAAAGALDVAAVLMTPALPVDVRHNSKIDRAAVAAAASALLAGHRSRGGDDRGGDDRGGDDRGGDDTA